MSSKLEDFTLRQTPTQKEIFLGLLFVLVTAFIYYMQWAYYLTSLPDSKVNIDMPEKYFWWADDSREYRATGDWMFGRPTQTIDRISGNTVITYIDIRPWVYPFIVGVTRYALGPIAETALWLLQLILWMGSTALLYFSLQQITGRVIFGIFGAAFFFMHPSPIAHTFHGMTETLNIFLLSVFCWLLSSKTKAGIWMVALFGFLTVIKPTYMLYLAILLIYFIWQTAKEQSVTRVRQFMLLGLTLIPIWIQMAFSFGYDRTLQISSIGPYTFKYFYVAVVHSQAEELTWQQSLETIRSWGLKEQLEYLLQNKRQAILTFRSNLIDTNLWTGSFFIRGESNRMVSFVLFLNGFTTLLHLIMLPAAFYAITTSQSIKKRNALMLVYGLFLIQTMTTGISTGQDDRLTVTGIPLWILSYALIFHLFMSIPSQTLETKINSVE
jgi:hypothetical protein